MIKTFIPSKNRACQLHYLLETMSKNAPGIFDCTIVYTAGDDQSQWDAYELLKSRKDSFGFPIKFFIQNKATLDYQLKNYLSANKDDLFNLMTDDTVVHTKITKDDEQLIRSVMNRDDIFTYSLRLGLNTVIQDYWSRRPQHPLIKYEDHDNYLSWHFEDYSPNENYGYPFSCDGTVYWCNDVLELLNFQFKNLRDLEGNLSLRRHEFSKNKMAAFRYSKCINSSNNAVTDNAVPAGLIYPILAEKMNDEYLAGNVLAAPELDVINSCHIEFPFFFRKYE